MTLKEEPTYEIGTRRANNHSRAKLLPSHLVGSMSKAARLYSQLHLLPPSQTDVELHMTLSWGWNFGAVHPPSNGPEAGQGVEGTSKSWSLVVQEGGALAKKATRQTAAYVQSEAR